MQKIFQTLFRLIGFVGLGVLIAGIGETQFSVFIRSDIPNLIGSIAFNILYLFMAGIVTGYLGKRLGDGLTVIIPLVAGSGIAGLMIEWFLIGNSPWGNPQASQIGMFSYWSAMVVVPFVCFRPDPRLKALKKTIFLSVCLYTFAALTVQLAASKNIQFIYHIWAVILGYTALILYTVFGYLRAVSGFGIPGPRAEQT